MDEIFYIIEGGGILTINGEEFALQEKEINKKNKIGNSNLINQQS